MKLVTTTSMNNKFLIFVAILNMGAYSFAVVRLTNIKCDEFDPPFATFEKCQLKMVERGVVALNIRANLHQIPVSNITLNVAIFKKSNGYRPYIYNTTTDLCLFFKNMKRDPLLKNVMGVVGTSWNMNHTCPYDHDIIVDNFIVKEEMFSVFLMSPGEYMFKLKFGAYNDWKADVKVYTTFNAPTI